MPVPDSRDLRIRKLLNARVSEKLKTFRDKIYSVYAYTPDCNITLSNLYDNFVEESGSHFGDTITRIGRHQDSQRMGKYTVYNYFDNDSLYAFDKYLEKLLQFIYNNREIVQGYRYPRITPRTIDKSMQQVVDWSMKNKNKSESNYYKGYATLALKSERGYLYLDPITTGVSKTLAGKLTPAEIDDEINEYFRERHTKTSVTTTEPARTTGLTHISDIIPKAIPKPAELFEDEADVYEYIDYTYHGKNGDKHCKLRIDSDEWFYDSEGVMNIRKIIAVGPEGMLIGTYRCDDGQLANRRVYTGLLYDEEYNPVQDEEETGEVFYPHKSLRAVCGEMRERVATELKTSTKDTGKKSTRKPKVKPDDPNQMTIFNNPTDGKDEM